MQTDAKHCPWIKICGLTDPDNAAVCAELGPDAIGLVFFPGSPRNVSIKQADAICSAVPSGIRTIGVFVNESFRNIIKTVQACGLKGVQLHGKESPELVTRLSQTGIIVIKAVFAAKKPLLTTADTTYCNASFLLAEYGKGRLPGGNAETWDYNSVYRLARKKPLVLAGGLDPDNIAQAIRSVRPAGVDVSSGVEKSPGIKDPDRVKAFIEKARSAESI